MTTKSKNRVSKADEIIAYRPKPTLNIYSDKLASVKDMKVGETYTFIVKAKVRSLRAGDDDYYPGDDDDDSRMSKTVCATLRVTDIKEE